jgi:hypothetical protein
LRYYIDSKANLQRITDSGNYMVFDPRNWHPVGVAGGRSRQP